MGRLLPSVILGVAGAMAVFGPVHAAGKTTHDGKVDWNKRDTAVYVVSTMNLLHGRHGQSASKVLQRDGHIVRYDVYDDTKDNSLYFIQLVRDDGTNGGVFAYSMGWKRPEIVTAPASGKVFARTAPQNIIDEYRTDPKDLIGSFTSTLPS